MSEPLLSAAMIVRDEAHHLPDCLRSIAELVDEMVVVDTGSRDDTIAIARSFGARVHEHPWRGGFAEPRNRALDLARGRWILYIDADERLRPLEVAAARRRLREAGEVSLRVRLSIFAGATPAWEHRLWRSDPRIRFVGGMHEKVTGAIAAVAAADGAGIGESPLHLDHVGYDGDLTHKHRRNLPLLERQLELEPDNAYNWHHLSRVRAGLGDQAAAEAALERAVEVGRTTVSAVGALPFVDLIARRQERGEDVSGLLEEALRLYPDNLGLAWLMSVAELRAGRPAAALRWLERLDLDPSQPVEDTTGYPAELFGARASEQRAACLFGLGRYREAERAWALAASLEPGNKGHCVKRALAAHRARSEPPGPVGPEASPAARWRAGELLDGLTISVAGVPVALRTTDGVRALAIHSLLNGLERDHRPAAASLSFSAHPVAVPDREPDAQIGDLDAWLEGDAIRMSFRGHITAVADPASGEAVIGGYFPQLERLFQQAAPFLLARVLAPHDRFVLHAAAIARAGRAMLVLGATGQGKSTTTAAALADGWELLSDDLVVLAPGPDGPHVHGIPRPLHVPREALPPDAPSWPLRDDPRGRHELAVAAPATGGLPVHAVVVSAHGDGDTAELQPLSSLEALAVVRGALLSRRGVDLRRLTSLTLPLASRPAARLRHARAPRRRASSAAKSLSELKP